MRKAALILVTAATPAATGVAAPGRAEARGGFGPGLAGGLIVGGRIGGLASSAYAYGPGYGYYGYGPGYYGGYGSYAVATPPLTMVDTLLRTTVTGIGVHTVR